MNPLVASIIRTIIPIIVGQVASWLLLANVVLPATSLDGLGTFLGGIFTAVYYVAVRVLEQQWPKAGVLLGLTASPDTYSKGTPAPAALPAVSVDFTPVSAAPAAFPKAAVDKAALPPVAAEPAVVAPVVDAPAVADPAPVA